MNIALYGGSFDPPHRGHLAVVNSALESLDIDQLIIVPTFVNPFKTGAHAPAKLRLQWLQELFKQELNVTISDFEVLQNRAVPSVETVWHFAQSCAKIYFIIGADNLASLSKWQEFEALNRLVTWVVAPRDGIMIDKRYIQLEVDYAISSSELRTSLHQDHLPQALASEIKNYYENNKETHAR